MSSTQSHEFMPSQQELGQLYYALTIPLRQGYLKVVPEELEIEGNDGLYLTTVLGSTPIQDILIEHGQKEYHEVVVRSKICNDEENDPAIVQVMLRECYNFANPNQTLRYVISTMHSFSVDSPLVYSAIRQLPRFEPGMVEEENFDDINDVDSAFETFFEQEMQAISPDEVVMLGRIATILAKTS